MTEKEQVSSSTEQRLIPARFSVAETLRIVRWKEERR